MAVCGSGLYAMLSEDENLALLTDAVGLDITMDETESSGGDFNVDIYATEIGIDTKTAGSAAV